MFRYGLSSGIGLVSIHGEATHQPLISDETNRSVFEETSDHSGLGLDLSNGCTHFVVLVEVDGGVGKDALEHWSVDMLSKGHVGVLQLSLRNSDFREREEEDPISHGEVDGRFQLNLDTSDNLAFMGGRVGNQVALKNKWVILSNKDSRTILDGDGRDKILGADVSLKIDISLTPVLLNFRQEHIDHLRGIRVRDGEFNVDVVLQQGIQHVLVDPDLFSLIQSHLREVRVAKEFDRIFVLLSLRGYEETIEVHLDDSIFIKSRGLGGSHVQRVVLSEQSGNKSIVILVEDHVVDVLNFIVDG